MNARYVRYLIARLSAYRNVWWSLANEWDVPRIKETIDWEGIGSLLQNEDPHQRLRGIHNWYYDESHFYDHTRPWVTHVSAQSYFSLTLSSGETQYDPYYMYGNTSEGADAIKRWKEGYNNDFAARMDWSISHNYADANHHPIAVLNGDKSRQVLEMRAAASSSMELSATGSSDPDGNSLAYSWFFYDEPSSYEGSVKIQNSSSPSAKLEIPVDAANKTLHIILEIHDSGTPNLYAYRRVIVHVKP